MKKFSLLLPVVAALLIFGTAVAYLVHREKSNPDTELRVSPAFREYVQAFTSGIVSTRSMIRVRLTEDLADSSWLGKPFDTRVFEITPGISGKTTWLDSRTIAFIPEEPLPGGETWTVAFALGKILTVPDSLKFLKFSFRTMQQVISVEVENHVAVAPARPGTEYLTGLLCTADEADAAAIEKALEARQNGRSLPVSWNHNVQRKEHTFRIDSIMRSAESSAVKISWDGDGIGSESKGDTVVEIPALGDFRVLAVRSVSGDQPCIEVRFSDLLANDRNFDGLFRAGQFLDVRYNVEDNRLRIWLPESQEKKITLSLDPSIRNIRGQELGKPFRKEIMVEDLRPNLRFAGDGVIMPSSSGMLLPFEAVNLRAAEIKVVRIFTKNILQFLQVNDLPDNSELARVGRIVLQKIIPLNGVTDRGKWNRFSIDLSTLMKAEPGAIYSVQLNFRKEWSTCACDPSAPAGKDDQDLVYISDPEQESDKEWGYYSNYFDNDYDNYGWREYRWEERNDPCKASYYFNRTISRNVLASDLGMIAKAGSDGNWHLFVTNLVTARPVTGASVEFYNLQMQKIGEGKTGAEGAAMIPLARKPFLVVAKYAGQTGYLKLQEGKSLSVSMFDVSGETVQKGLKGFIYGERGVWRPGDSIFLTFMLEDQTGRLPVTHPVVLSLFNPSGQLINRLVRTNAVNGFYRFSTATAADAPTGNWQARVNVGNVEFSKSLKIETVKPNRLRIRFDFGTDKLMADKIPPVTLKAEWLTGAIARNLRANVMLTLVKSTTSFKNFPQFIFDNPTVGFAPENITIFDGKLDDVGQAILRPDIHVTNVAPGALRASFETNVFEDGGDFSTDRFSIPFYPYETYAGLKIPGDDNRVLETDKSYPVELLNVDAGGNPVASSQLKVEVYKLEWRWWWDDTRQGSADFVSIAYNRPVDSGTVRTSGGRATYQFHAAYNDWGRYLIKVTDIRSGHAAGTVVYADWPGYWRIPGGEKQAAAMLTLTAGKSVYQVGEKVTLSLPTSPEGRALVTIENGTTLLRSFWIPTKQGSTEITFDATADMTPNCYACVTLLQPHAQTLNDLPIRLYGIVPVVVENPGTHLKPLISMPGELKPGSEVTIDVKESSGNAMTYTLAMVDEGLLDLTRFKTPDPWKAFNAREALGVKTWDLFDQVMGAFTGDLQRILSIGGDQEALSKGALKANRFKPVVKFFGPVELRKGQTNHHRFKMPEYVGSVRVMLVAGRKGAYGYDEKTVPVRSDLMALATLPRVLGPGETVRMPVTVFAMNKKISSAKVEVFTDDLLSVTAPATKQVTFNGRTDQIVPFELKVAEMTGIAHITVVVTSGKERTEHNVEIGVRNPNLPVTNVLEMAITAGGFREASIVAPGIRGTNSGALELSSIPALNLEKRLNELIRYPYGCIEQTVSAVFPQLYLPLFTELSDRRKREVEKNINAAIRRIQSYIMPSGGFGYWPGAPYSDDWSTSYAGHFLLEAEKAGYALPAGWLTQWKEFQRGRAVFWNYGASVYNDDLAQAYRLFTLALAGAPELGAMNKLLEYKQLSLSAKWRLAAAYLVAGKREIAQQLSGNATFDIKPYRESGNTFGSDLRDKAMILETLVLLGSRTTAAPLAREIAAALSSGEWMSTQTTAFSLLSLARFAGNATGTGIQASVSINGETIRINSKMPVWTCPLEVTPAKKGSLRIDNSGKSVLFARVVTTGIPARGEATAVAQNLALSVTWKSMNGEVINPARLKQGTSFVAEVMVKNPGLRGKYQQLALSQIFPSGWEIVNARNSDLALSKSNPWLIDYQDVRDDRVYTFFDLEAGKFKSITVMLIATWSGKYYLPATLCSAMYDNSINARAPGMWVEVVPAAE